MTSVGTFCSGIGAPEVAMRDLSGWHSVFVSEIEPFPCAVLAHHFPDVPNIGDMNAVDGEAWRGKVDVIVAGTPCQAFSLAGMRRGLEDERGNLTLKLVELVNAIEPTCLLWENVPGVLSDKGNAFGCFLAGLAGETVPLVAPGGRWTNAGYVRGPQRAVAWRVLDAQYFGVAQRRRRVFLVASPRNGADPRAILFESDGLRRDAPPSRSTGQGVAHDVAPCIGASGRWFDRAGETRGQDHVVACLNGISNYGADVPTLRSKGGDAADGSEALVAQPVAFDGYDHTTDNDCFATLSTKADHNRQLVFQAGPVPCAGGSKALAAHTWPAEVAPTLNAAFGAKHGLEDQHALGGAGLFVPCTQYGDMAGTLAARHDSSPCADRGMNVLAFHGSQDPNVSGGVTHHVGRNQGQETCVAYNETLWDAQEKRIYDVRKGTAPTLSSRSNGGGTVDGYFCVPAPAHAFKVRCGCKGGGKGYLGSDDTAFTLSTGADQHLQHGMSVRRLTPTECERLQGFQDDYTRIAWRNKPATACPDGPRYKALGNSMAVPCVAWILKRIDKELGCDPSTLSEASRRQDVCGA